MRRGDEPPPPPPPGRRLRVGRWLRRLAVSRTAGGKGGSCIKLAGVGWRASKSQTPFPSRMRARPGQSSAGTSDARCSMYIQAPCSHLTRGHVHDVQTTLDAAHLQMSIPTQLQHAAGASTTCPQKLSVSHITMTLPAAPSWQGWARGLAYWTLRSSSDLPLTDFARLIVQRMYISLAAYWVRIYIDFNAAALTTR